MRVKLVAGNWKMNGSKAGIRKLIAGILARVKADSDVELVVIPAYIHLPLVKSLIEDTPVRLGAQDLSEHESGAYTGEISGAMLAEFACRFVLVGHSERRSIHGESDEQVAAKFEAAQSAGLKPILCVGESLEDREADRTRDVVGRQLGAVIDRVGIEALGHSVIAYEPVWAIGTGRTASPEQAQEIHAFIREQIAERDAIIAGRVRILYGGSVKPENAMDLFAREDIDGGLIGGASLSSDAFMDIYRAAD